MRTGPKKGERTAGLVVLVVLALAFAVDCASLDGLGGRDAGRDAAVGDAVDGRVRTHDSGADPARPEHDASGVAEAGRPDGRVSDVGAGDAGRDGRPPHDALATDGPARDAHAQDAPAQDATKDAPVDAPHAEAALTYAEEVLADVPLGYYRLDDSALPVAKDSSGNGNDGTYVGGVTLGVAGALAGDTDPAVTLNGTTGFMRVPNQFAFTASAPFAVEAWVRPAILNTEYRGLLSNQSSPDAGREGYLVYMQSVAGVGFERWHNNSSNPLAAAGAVSAGAWTHLVGSYDGTVITLYANGAVVAGPAASNLSIASHVCSFTVGALFCGTDGFFPGTVDEVAVYGHALSAARVLAHYRVGKGGP